MANDKTWSIKVEIRDPNPNSPLVNIIGTRTVGADVRMYPLRSISLDKTKKSMAAIRQDIEDRLTAKFEADEKFRADKAAMPATYTGLAAALEAAMNAKETS